MGPGLNDRALQFFMACTIWTLISAPGTRFPRAVSPRHAPAGLPRRAYPAGVSHTRSNQLCYLNLDRNHNLRFPNPFCPQFFYGLYNLDVDFRSRHSLSAGGQGASSACACGVSPRRAYPAGVSCLPLQSTLLFKFR